MCDVLRFMRRNTLERKEARCDSQSNGDGCQWLAMRPAQVAAILLSRVATYAHEAAVAIAGHSNGAEGWVLDSERSAEGKFSKWAGGAARQCVRGQGVTHRLARIPTARTVRSAAALGTVGLADQAWLRASRLAGKELDLPEGASATGDAGRFLACFSPSSPGPQGCAGRKSALAGRFFDPSSSHSTSEKPDGTGAKRYPRAGSKGRR